MPTAPPPSSPSSGPDPGRPLTEREKQALAELGSELQASDPSLGSKLSIGRPVDRRGWLTFDRVVQAMAVLAVVLVLLPAAWFGLLFALALMVGVPLLLLLLVDPELRSRVNRSAGKDDQPPQEGHH